LKHSNSCIFSYCFQYAGVAISGRDDEDKGIGRKIFRGWERREKQDGKVAPLSLLLFYQ